MLPKCFSFLQLCMCFALLKKYKIPIFNAAMDIKTIVSAKYFLRNFSITLSKCSMFAFIIISPITKFGFCFPNVELQHKFYILIDTELAYIFSGVMKTIQCANPPYQHNGFVATCRLWMASGGVHALLVLQPTECPTSSRQGAYIFIFIYTYKPFATTATQAGIL